jgi:hypothetical protein
MMPSTETTAPGISIWCFSGSRNPTDVLAQHARLGHPHKDETGVWKTPLRPAVEDRRCPSVQLPPGIPGTLSSLARNKPDVDLLSTQETLNFWKQLTHVLKYFRAEEDPKSALPKNFIQGFIEVRNFLLSNYMQASCIDAAISRDATREQNNHDAPFDFPQPFRNDTILNRNPIVSICTKRL